MHHLSFTGMYLVTDDLNGTRQGPCVREKDKTEIEIQDSLDALVLCQPWASAILRSFSETMPSPLLWDFLSDVWKNLPAGVMTASEQLRKFKQTWGFFLESLVPAHVRMCVGESEY